MKIMYKLLITVVVFCYLFISCKNTWMKSLLPDKINEPDPPGVYKISIVKNNAGTGDDIYAQPIAGDHGDSITLHYTVANTKAYNLLYFSGTEVSIDTVESAGTGTRFYTINTNDAINGEIKIFATFEHTDIAPGPITFTILIDSVQVGEAHWHWEDGTPITPSGELIVSYAEHTPTNLQLSGSHDYANIVWYINGMQTGTGNAFRFLVSDHFSNDDIGFVRPLSVDVEIDSVPYTINMWILVND